MSFLKGRDGKDIAAHPLPTSSGRSPGMPAEGPAPDFRAILADLRRSFLDEPLASSDLDIEVGPALNFLRVARVPRRIDDQGRPVPSGSDRERLLLTGLHGLGQPIALRVENRAAELHLGLGIGSLGASDTLGRSMTSQYPGSHFGRLDLPDQPLGCAMALMVGTPQPPPEVDLHPQSDLGSLATALRGREWGLTVSARPVARVDTVRLVGTLTEQAHAWSAHVREGIDASSQKGQAVTLATRRERVDREAQLAVEWLEVILNRTTRGEGEGLWEWSGLLWGRDADTLNMAGALALGLFAGPAGLPEPLRIVRFPDTFDLRSAVEGSTRVTVAGTALVTLLPSSHLATLLRFPREAVPGFSTLPSAAFSTATTAGNPATPVTVGEILDRGTPTGCNLTIPLSELTKHSLVVGMTGSGKTNTCMGLLRECAHHNVPFLVIEPAKAEYRSLLREEEFGRTLQVFTLGDETTSPFRLNPFVCPDGFPIATHLDYLKSVMTSSFAMYGPMPHILEEAVLRVYEKRGWDLAQNTNRHHGRVERHLLFPTLGDLLAEIDPVVQAIGYAQELTMDIRGALKTRIGSLLAGAKGLMLGGVRSTPLETLLGRPTVLELASLGDDQEKSLLMGLLLIGIYEHRQAQGTVSGRLLHVTLIEEAHRILKNVSTTTSPEIANVAGKALDTFNNILSEIRTYGEGLIIAEQIPAKLSPDAMKNTGLKLAHRLHAVDDRTAVGDTMVLSRAQNQEVARLPDLSAVAFGAGLAEAVLIGVVANKPEFVDGFAPVSNQEVVERARAFHSAHRDALERFPACVSCPNKCQRPQEAAEVLDDPDSSRYRAFSRLLLAWTLGARPDEEAVASVGGPSGKADEYCVGAHLVNRYFRERAGFYGLSPTERALLERELAQAATGGEWTSLTAGQFRRAWLGYLERKATRQQETCRECRSPFCYGYEMDRSLSDVERLDQFSRIDTSEECQAFLATVAADALGARVPSLQERLGYCFFIRRYSDVRVENADGKYNRLTEIFT